jgi:Putative carbonic anhydrase
MSADGKKLGIAVVCVDWRLHQKEVRLSEAVCDALGVDVVDVAALPGPDGVLKPTREGERDALVKGLKLLVGAHHPVSIALVGHYSCAGNPVDDPVHDVDAKETADFLKTETGFKDVRAFSAVRMSDMDWKLKEL